MCICWYDSWEEAVISGTLRGVDTGLGGGQWWGAETSYCLCLPVYLNQAHVLKLLGKKQQQYNRNIREKRR